MNEVEYKPDEIDIMAMKQPPKEYIKYNIPIHQEVPVAKPMYTLYNKPKLQKIYQAPYKPVPRPSPPPLINVAPTVIYQYPPQTPETIISNNVQELSEKVDSDEDSDKVKLHYEFGIKITPYILDYFKQKIEEMSNAEIQLRSSPDDALGAKQIQFKSNPKKDLQKNENIKVSTNYEKRKEAIKQELKKELMKELREEHILEELKNESKTKQGNKNKKSKKEEKYSAKDVTHEINAKETKIPLKEGLKILRRGQMRSRSISPNKFFTFGNKEYAIKIKI